MWGLCVLRLWVLSGFFLTIICTIFWYWLFLVVSACGCWLVKPNHVNFGILCGWFIFFSVLFCFFVIRKIIYHNTYNRFLEILLPKLYFSTSKFSYFLHSIPDIFICFDWLVRVIFICHIRLYLGASFISLLLLRMILSDSIHDQVWFSLICVSNITLI